MLGDLVIAHRFGAQVFAKAGLLEATVGRLAGQRQVIVDPDRAKLQLGRELHSSANIAGEDRGGQPVRHIVGQQGGLGFVLKFADRDDWAEYLALNNLAVLGSFADDSWLVKSNQLYLRT